MGLRSVLERSIRKSRLTKTEAELERIQAIPAFTSGYTNIFGKPFKFNDGASFAVTYKEIFEHQLYAFKPAKGKDLILDCGANMGLSVLFFALNYPDHKILAFEPDAPIHAILKENVATFDLKNVTLFDKAVWDKEELLEFYTDKGMGGRVNVNYSDQAPVKIRTVRLRDYLTAGTDFLKLDIEGAEDVVLRDCKDKLSGLTAFFFEYHNDIQKPQSLHELLGIVKEAGFHYYIKESSVRDSPFKDTHLICETFDMAINVFCYR